MAYIYKIVNDINNKIYIGKTENSIEKRFREHCRDAFRKRNKNRPLYSAMQKYGIEHFHVELVEKTNNPEEREQYWIQEYGSFKYGYNATLGGDGKHYKDYDLVYSLYKKGKTIKQICEILNYDAKTCRAALDKFNISHEERVQRKIEQTQKPILQLDKDTKEVLNVFPSIAEAYRYLGKQHSGHIAAVCNGKRKTAYGYIWKYDELYQS